MGKGNVLQIYYFHSFERLRKKCFEKKTDLKPYANDDQKM